MASAPKTKSELLKLGFMAVKKHAASLGIDTKLGSTKAGLVKLILAKDPPPADAEANESDLKPGEYGSIADKQSIKTFVPKKAPSQTNLSSTVAAATAADEKQSETAMNGVSQASQLTVVMATSDDMYRNNDITLDDGLSIIKKHSRAWAAHGVGTNRYFALSNLFQHINYEKLTYDSFREAVLTCDERVLTQTMMGELQRLLHAYDDDCYYRIVNALSHFIPPPETPHSQQLMFACFAIPDVRWRMDRWSELYDLRDTALRCRQFMDTLTQSLDDVLADETYQKLVIASLLICKFRGEDTHLSGDKRFKNLADFLTRTTVQPTSTEIFQAKKFDKLQKEGRLHQKIMVPFQVSDLNAIRAKAIQFGSAVAPPITHIEKKDDGLTTAERVQKEIGTKVNTADVRSKLASQLVLRGPPKAPPPPLNDAPLQSTATETSDKPTSNDVSSDDVDFTAYEKMFKMGIPMSAIRQKMAMNGVASPIQTQFELRMESSKNSKISEEKPTLDNSETKESSEEVSVSQSPLRSMNAMLQAGIVAAAKDRPVPTDAPMPPPVPGVVPPPAPTDAPPNGDLRTTLAGLLGRPTGYRHMQPTAVPQPAAIIQTVTGAQIASIQPDVSVKELKKHSNLGLEWGSCMTRFHRVDGRMRGALQRSIVQFRDTLAARYEATDFPNVTNDDEDDGDDDDDADGEGKEATEEKTAIQIAEAEYCTRFAKQESLEMDSLLSQCDMILNLTKGFEMKSEANKAKLRRLVEIYHRKFRLQILNNIKEPRFNSLMNVVSDDLEIFVPMDIFGLIWSYVKPFDELIEMKFAVDTLLQFMDSRKERLEVKKLPIQSHRGYERIYN